MIPIQYFNSARKAISPLKKNGSLKNKVGHAIKMLEASHVIITKGYDRLFDELYADGLSSSSQSKREKFNILSSVYWKNTTAIKTIAPYYKEIAILKYADKLFDGCTKTEEKKIAKTLESDPGFKKLMQNIEAKLKDIPKGIGLGSVIQLVRNYYKKKSVLFQEE